MTSIVYIRMAFCFLLIARSLDAECVNRKLTSGKFITRSEKVAPTGAEVLSISISKYLSEDIGSCEQFDTVTRQKRYDFTGDTAWVSKGCRGEFTICLEGGRCEDRILESLDMIEYKEVIVPGKNIVSMTLKRQLSTNFGCSDNGFSQNGDTATVSRGCRVKISSKVMMPGGKLKTPKKVLQSRSYTEDSQVIQPGYTILTMVMNDQITDDLPCVEEENYGFSGETAWANGGCRASFIFTFAPICRDVTMESVKGRYAERFVSEFKSILNVTLKTEYSENSCDSAKDDFGYVEDTIYVKHGCHALFTVCHENFIDMPLFSDPVPVSFITTDVPIPFGPNYSTVSLFSQLTDEPCTLGETFGVSGDRFWVSDGCAGTFEFSNGVSTRLYSAESRSYAKTSTVIAEGRTIASMTVTNRLSRAECQQGQDFGFVRDRAWVINGCTAEFNICF